jgi:hypothetical protein
MGLFDRFAQLFGDWHWSESGPDLHEPPAINPATGLLMMDGQGSVDVAGNPFGTDLHRHHRDDDWSRHNRWDTGSSFDSGTRWQDPCSSAGSGGGHDPWRS